MMHNFELPDWEQPRKNDIVIRQSDVESLTLCPARMGYRGVKGHDSAPSEPMAFGTLVHAMLDKHIETMAPIPLGKLLNAEYVRTLLVEVMLKDGHHPLSLTNTYHIDQIAREAIYTYRQWIDQWWLPIGSNRQIISYEETKIKPLGMINKTTAVWVQGTADLVHTFGVDDWKTAGRGWDKGKSGTRIQAPTYVWLEAEHFHHLSRVPFTYVVYDRAKQVWSEHITYIEPANIDATLNAFMTWAKMIHREVYPPTPTAPTGRPGRGWWCSAKFCGAWNICEYKGMLPDGADLAKVRSPEWAN